MGTSLIAPDAVRAHLRRLLVSERIASAASIARLLKYTVEKTLSGESGVLKEYTLGIDVFDRGEAFDPKIDSIVRVQARKLRARLEEYYAGEGLLGPDSYRIPKGWLRTKIHHLWAGQPSRSFVGCTSVQQSGSRQGKRLPQRRSHGGTHSGAVADSRSTCRRADVNLCTSREIRGRAGGRERLRVRYIVAGSVRQAGGRLRVSAELVEAEAASRSGLSAGSVPLAMSSGFRTSSRPQLPAPCVRNLRLVPSQLTTLKHISSS